ncbi:FG-GAP-like repeat-containing protein [Streptomyces sp. NPDC059247]|uniref:FG-GAP-like repeat-containing protein n=1 Tax=Streptomyces sp. NPDC059247 TaxID=3346790 RepID=UPI0036B35507
MTAPAHEQVPFATPQEKHVTPGTARRALAAAITTVLAATALATAPAATAVPGARAAGAAAPAAKAQAVPKIPASARLVGAGASGYFATNGQYNSEGYLSYDYRWYRPDGTSTLLVEAWAESRAMINMLVSDMVAVATHYDGQVVRLHDMSAPAGTAPVLFDLRTLGPTHRAVGLHGSTLLVEVGVGGEPKELHLVTKAGNTLTDRKVTGVPGNIRGVTEADGLPGSAFLSYEKTGTSYGHATVTVDLASATASVTHPYTDRDGTAFSATKIVRRDASGLVVTDRASGTGTRIALTGLDGPLALFGDFVAYTTRGTAPAFSARSLTDGSTVKLLDKATGISAAPNGTLLVRGGTVEQGEGIYRIATGTDGVPAATLIASTGEETALKLLGTSIGPVVDLDPMNGRVYLSWDLSHDDFDADVEITHKATRQKFTYRTNHGSRSIHFLWDGDFDRRQGQAGLTAPNGAYSWKLTAKPHDNIGPDLEASGDFTLVRSPKIHDFNDNGTPDLLVRDTSGNLMTVDTTYDTWRERVAEGDGSNYAGRGWQGYRQVESVGDVAGTKAPDVIGIDSAGVLWFHPGTGLDGESALAPRVKIGGGWGVYNQLAGGSDLTGDGRADLVAVDKAGDLYLYKGTGNPNAPFAPRKKTGFGWNIYNKITAVGNLAGGPAGDLVARDKNGVLWLYLGKGDGTFAARTKVGAGWNQYTHIVGIGDATMDGRPDLYAYGPHNTVYIHQGSGNWRAPFQERTPTDVLSGMNGTFVDKVF